MINRPSFNSWVLFPKPNAQAHLRLFCYPYAGGGASVYFTWLKFLLHMIEVCPIQPPGRGSRLYEQPFTKLAALVQECAGALLPYLDKPFAFFGHSLGALVVFELTRLLRREYGIVPVHLFVSGYGAPHWPSSKSTICELPETEFLAEIKKLNGTPKEVLEDIELMRLMLPALRSDFAISNQYIYVDESPLDISISAFGGLSDSGVNRERLEAWREQTTAKFSLEMFPGDHFFINTAQSSLLTSLSRHLFPYLDSNF